jgi:hypothetical protein
VRNNPSLSATQRIAEAAPHEARITIVKKEFEHQLQLSTQSQQQLEAEDPDDDPNVGMAQLEMRKEVEAYQQGLANVEVALLQAKAVKTNQQIGDVLAKENAKVRVGLPQSVVDKVERQIIGNVIGEAHAEVAVGIFE